jgi:hypothetical protein
MSVCGLRTVLYVVVTIISRNFGLVFERVAVWQRCCSVRNMSDLIKLTCTVFVRDKEVNRLNTEENKKTPASWPIFEIISTGARIDCTDFLGSPNSDIS